MIIVKLHSVCALEFSGEKCFFQTNYRPFRSLGENPAVRAKKSCENKRNIFSGRGKMHFTCSKEQFGEDENIEQFSCFLGFRAKIFGTLSKNFLKFEEKTFRTLNEKPSEFLSKVQSTSQG